MNVFSRDDDARRIVPFEAFDERDRECEMTDFRSQCHVLAAPLTNLFSSNLCLYGFRRLPVMVARCDINRFAAEMDIPCRLLIRFAYSDVRGRIFLVY